MHLALVFLILMQGCCCLAQPLGLTVRVEEPAWADRFFRQDAHWLGADGASSIALGQGRVLWLFSDSFIGTDTSGLRQKATLVRNSIALQEGDDLSTATLRYYWGKTRRGPRAFFRRPGKEWFWTGAGALVGDKLLIFLMRVRDTSEGLGFKITGWRAVSITNPAADPATWRMKYLRPAKTFGTIAGSASVLQDTSYLYAFGAVEPSSHEVYLLRWPLASAYAGNLRHPEWWMNGQWMRRRHHAPVGEPLFVGATEYSVHYDPQLKQYVQMQTYGFGAATLGVRFSPRMEGPWSAPLMVFTPSVADVPEPIIYAAKAHPELQRDGLVITYNVNSLSFDELLRNLDLYFPEIRILYLRDFIGN